MKSGFKYKQYQIFAKQKLAPDTFLFTLSGKLKFEPGQFVQVSLPYVGEATFAPCSNPSDRENFQLCIRACGNTTNQLVGQLPGDSMLIRGPYGHGWPLGKLIGKNVVLVTGGLGIIPIRPLIFELLKYKKQFKKLTLLSGFKTPEFVIFDEDYSKWLKQLNYCKVAVEKSSRNWWGETCLPTELLKNISLSAKNTYILICGPEIMFKFCIDVLNQKAIPDNQIYISYERRMECGVGLCQHCNIGKYLVCKDGPVFRWDLIKSELNK